MLLERRAALWRHSAVPRVTVSTLLWHRDAQDTQWFVPGRQAVPWDSIALCSKYLRRCYPEGCAAAGVVQCQCNARGSLSKLEG